MSTSPFELEHWKSRAKIAEAERDSGRSVLARLRSHFHWDKALEAVREALKLHDVEWWNRDHAMNAVAEALEEIGKDELTTLDIVFDGPPSHLSGRFVEVELLDGRSVGVGRWIDRGNGLWALRIPGVDLTAKEAEADDER